MREVINNIFDKEVTSALDGFPSVYSKDDLICVVNRIRLELNELELESTKPEISKKDLNIMFQEVVGQLTRQLERNDNEYIDYDNAEFSIGYHNTVEVSNIDIIVDNITDSLEIILEELFYEALDVR